MSRNSSLSSLYMCIDKIELVVSALTNNVMFSYDDLYVVLVIYFAIYIFVYR